MYQTIEPSRKICFAGESVTFKLFEVPPNRSGRAVVRTNLGRAAIHRREEIEQTNSGRPPVGLDWRDVLLLKQPDGSYQRKLPLAEVGIFEAKCCFIPDDGGAIIWPESDNFHIKVEPSESASGNTIYCAFVRQFGPGCELSHSQQDLPEIQRLEQVGCKVLPPSGTFRDLEGKLNHIFKDLNCRILQLLPIHPVPTVYGRMGRYGSPFAAIDYFAVDPALATFDTKTTPLEQFVHLIDAVHAHDGRIFMDIPVNHTGWASKLQCEHPEYFVRRKNGEFESPGAWGIIWADLCKLNYQDRKVHKLMAKVFLFWCRRGVDGFRCDAGYMLPFEAWRYIVAKVRSEYPDTVFLLEGLGGPVDLQERLLNSAGLDWGYSELFQNYSRDEITRYYPYSCRISEQAGTLVNFAETHDNHRLATSGNVYATMRFMVTGLLAHHGGFGFANGAEFFATENIDVHGRGGLNYGATPNLIALIWKINHLLLNHPAFGPDGRVKLITAGSGNVIAVRRYGENIPELLIVINLDCEHSNNVGFVAGNFKDRGIDLLTGEHVVFQINGEYGEISLSPGSGRCISFDEIDWFNVQSPLIQRRANAMAQRTALRLTTLERAGEVSGEKLLNSPADFIRELTGSNSAVHWRYPQDCHRVVMLAPGDCLLVTAQTPFHCELFDNDRCIAGIKSLPGKNGNFFALLAPEADSGEKELVLHITVYTSTGAVHGSGKILSVASAALSGMLNLSSSLPEALNNYAFGTNNSGSYAFVSGDWGKIHSKYEALLAVNPVGTYPSDRIIGFTRCRAFLVVDGFSNELTGEMLEKFTGTPRNRARWEFSLPSGQGCRSKLSVDMHFATCGNGVKLVFHRPWDVHDNPVSGKLILRPDVEHRVNHQLTRAYCGAETAFPAAVKSMEQGFSFMGMIIRSAEGKYYSEPEWHYMTDLPNERYYGLDDKTDLFSPGYFSIPLPPGGKVTLTAEMEGSKLQWPSPELAETCSVEDLAVPALRRFVVKRDDLSTVIAGYPWFLDWGRDTLIVLRGLVKFPEFRTEARNIILRFARFEHGGTIPNMICGSNDSNRDTSDAPLWLILAVRDFCEATGTKDILDADCGHRNLDGVLNSIVNNYRTGTANGIKMDEDSGLIYSPSHFTWMDTNFPAGTPRAGYPIEIQALWYAALKFLKIDDLAEKVANSVEKYYFTYPGIVSDCLHCSNGTPASMAVADDHSRCNQLFALTLGVLRKPEHRAIAMERSAELLIPGGIRTLDDIDTRYQLPIERFGEILNHPNHPYCGYYRGAEDTERKVAYHNGTAWAWPFPMYCEALFMENKEAGRQRALALLLSVKRNLENGVPGELPEVMDGDAPHRFGGCPAQAWSISEFFRVYRILRSK